MSDDFNRDIFKEEAQDLLAELEGTLLELEQDPEDMDLVNRVFRALHTIKGSGAMFGFDHIAEFTHEVETVFDDVRGGSLGVTNELITLVFRARDHIQNLLESDTFDVGIAATGGDILGDLKALVGAEAEDISGQPTSEASPADAELPESMERPAAAGDASPSEADEGLPSEPEDVQPGKVIDAPERDGALSAPPADPGAKGDSAQVCLITLLARDENGGMGLRLLPLLEELEKLGPLTIVADGAALSSPEALEPERLYKELNLRLETASQKQDVEDVFFFSEIDLDVDVRMDGECEAPAAAPPAPSERTAPQPSAGRVYDDEVDDSDADKMIGELLVESGDVDPEVVAEAVAAQKTLGEVLTESGKVPREKVKQAVARQQAAREKRTRQQAEVMSSIRVAAEKLDYLVDLVGELVIVQAQISQVVSHKADPQLTSLAEELERLSDELRDSTLGIRMLPIGSTFSKFRRLVRDLSSELGKEINLATQGAETELDKTVIERLGDPLVHLLRNSIDHGIESPEAREKAGKPPVGNIVLSAEHSGGEVLIRITDDGRGIDAEAVREKAVQRGLISADSELSDSELFSLIFQPGFSTAKSVTSVSGRGVGMDVVKRAIDALRGRIQIDSAPGKGTTITVLLPLTLAIIDGLQVLVGSEYYVIPLSLVEECVELRRTPETKDSIVNLRGEIVPYINLREWFDIDGKAPEIEQVVITSVEGSRVGIVVDHVVGEHQTVIKTLGRVYRDVEGISGATIKGDGSMALILDVPRLVRIVSSRD